MNCGVTRKGQALAFGRTVKKREAMALVIRAVRWGERKCRGKVDIDGRRHKGYEHGFLLTRRKLHFEGTVAWIFERGTFSMLDR